MSLINFQEVRLKSGIIKAEPLALSKGGKLPPEVVEMLEQLRVMQKAVDVAIHYLTHNGMLIQMTAADKKTYAARADDADFVLGGRFAVRDLTKHEINTPSKPIDV